MGFFYSSMNFILFDPATRSRLFPFTHTRPVADIRCGILTLRERWEKFTGNKTFSLCPPYLQDVFPAASAGDNVFINGSLMATADLWQAIQELNPGDVLVQEGVVLAARVHTEQPTPFDDFPRIAGSLRPIAYPNAFTTLERPWDIFLLNDSAIRTDYQLLTEGRVSAPLPAGITAIAAEHIFLEEGAVVNPCIINAGKGPVYVAAGAEIMEGCIIRGPLAMGKNSALKMGAKVYGATTIGEGSKVGGEVSNVVFFANSNKGHDGFLGNAVIGEWCNLGADTNCSNLKNNYDIVKVWDEDAGKLVSTGLQFCGVMMGDHSKSGINTMFNTGTVVGVSCNIFGSDFPEKFVPSFSWGGAGETTPYDFDKAMETANRMMERRGLSLSDAARKMYRYLSDRSKQ